MFKQVREAIHVEGLERHHSLSPKPLLPVMSEAAAVVGIVTTALHASKLVYNDIKAITNAPETITKLYREVEELTQKLELVGKIENDEWHTLGPTAAIWYEIRFDQL